MGPTCSLVLQLPVWGLGDLMRLVCGLSTLRLFKADLKISGWCYYTSEEEETTLAWRSRSLRGELLCGCSWAGQERLQGWPPRTRAAGVPGGSCETGGGQEGGSGNRVPAMM